MGMMQEFKEFAMKGNVVDMAVGIVIGGAFGTVVRSLVDNIITPPIGYVAGQVDFTKLSLKIPVIGDGPPVEIRYGLFINSVITFIVVAFVVWQLGKRFIREDPAVPVKNCPFCKEANAVDATKCKYCASAI